MAVILKPIKDFIDQKDQLERVPKEMYPLAKQPMPWTGYLAFSDEDVLVGVCAFKDVPNYRNEVEIAYYTFPEFEGRGHATSMASLLIDLAKTDENASALVAHTLREKNASAHICEKLGLEFKGDILDQEDGLVWRWEIEV